MKKEFLLATLVSALLLTGLTATAETAKPELWVNGKRVSQANIQVVAERRNLEGYFERWLDAAVADLERILPLFGVELSPDAPFSIIVGGKVPEPLQALVEKERYPNQASVIRISDQEIYVTSPGGRGLSKAVYTFLDRLGVRWYTPGKWGEVLPDGRVKLSKGSFVEGPDFLFRSFYWGKSESYSEDMAKDYQRWHLRMRMDNEFGFSGHSYSQYIAPPHKYASDHPEYYSLIGGERIAPPQTHKKYIHQLCVSNKEVQQLAIDFARRHFKQLDLHRFVSISPNDGGLFCQCGPCREIGGDMEQTVFLANVVARAVRDEFPDHWVAFYAYSSHLLPPEEVELEPNVVPYIVNSLHEVGQAEWKYWSAPVRKTGLAKVIKDWATSGGRTALRFNWGLNGGGLDMAGFFYPYNWVSHLQDDFRFFLENKGVGVMAESESSFIHQGWLNYWAARLGWNVNLDVESEEAALYQRFYGPVAGTAKEALQRIQNQQDLARPLLIARLQKHVGLLKDAIAGLPDKVFRVRSSHLLHYLQFLLARERYYDGKESLTVVLRSLKQILKDRSHALNTWTYYYPIPKISFQEFVRVQEDNIGSWRDPVVYSATQHFAIKVEEPDKEIRFHLRHIRRRNHPGPLELILISPKGYLVYQKEVPIGAGLDEVIPVAQHGTYMFVVRYAGHFQMEVENPLFVARTWSRYINEPDKTVTRYFYVPRAADSFIFMMNAPPQNKGWFRLIDQTGQVRLSGKDVKGTEKFEVKVPANGRGKIWKLELGGVGETRQRFLFFGDQPAWLASEPNRLIVPVSYLR